MSTTSLIEILNEESASRREMLSQIHKGMSYEDLCKSLTIDDMLDFVLNSPRFMIVSVSNAQMTANGIDAETPDLNIVAHVRDYYGPKEVRIIEILHHVEGASISLDASYPHQDRNFFSAGLFNAPMAPSYTLNVTIKRCCLTDEMINRVHAAIGRV